MITSEYVHPINKFSGLLMNVALGSTISKSAMMCRSTKEIREIFSVSAAGLGITTSLLRHPKYGSIVVFCADMSVQRLVVVSAGNSKRAIQTKYVLKLL